MSNVKGNPIQFLEEGMSQAEEQFTDAPPLPATRIPRRNQLCACHSASTAIRHCSTARKLEGHVCFCWGAAERKLGKVGRWLQGHRDQGVRKKKQRTVVITWQGLLWFRREEPRITQSRQLGVCRCFWFPRQPCLNQTEIKTPFERIIQVLGRQHKRKGKEGRYYWFPVLGDRNKLGNEVPWWQLNSHWDLCSPIILHGYPWERLYFLFTNRGASWLGAQVCHNWPKHGLLRFFFSFYGMQIHPAFLAFPINLDTWS